MLTDRSFGLCIMASMIQYLIPNAWALATILRINILSLTKRILEFRILLLDGDVLKIHHHWSLGYSIIEAYRPESLQTLRSGVMSKQIGRKSVPPRGKRTQKYARLGT